MKLVEKFNQDIIKNMKEKNRFVLDVLRMVKGSMQLENINNKTEINDELLIATVQKQIKSRNESIKEFEKGQRLDLINKTKDEIKVLEEYLPTQLTDEEIVIKINEIFDTIKPQSMADMGKIMKEATAIFKGVADMSVVSKIIKEKLVK